MDLFPNCHFLYYFLSYYSPCFNLRCQSRSEAVSAMARGDNPCFLCMCELDTPGWRTWNLSPSKPGSQVLFMLLPLVQALKNLLEPHSPAQLCVWRCCRVVGTGWKAKTAWAASVSSPVVSRTQPWTHAHSVGSHTKE